MLIAQSKECTAPSGSHHDKHAVVPLGDDDDDDWVNGLHERPGVKDNIISVNLRPISRPRGHQLCLSARVC